MTSPNSDQLSAHLTRDAILPTPFDSARDVAEKKRLIYAALAHSMSLADVLGIDNGLNQGSNPEENACASMNYLQYDLYIGWRDQIIEMPPMRQEEDQLLVHDTSNLVKKRNARRLIALNRLYRVEPGHYDVANLKWWEQQHKDPFIHLLTGMERVVAGESAMTSGTTLSPEDFREYRALKQVATEFAKVGKPFQGAIRGRDPVLKRLDAYKVNLRSQSQVEQEQALAGRRKRQIASKCE